MTDSIASLKLSRSVLKSIEQIGWDWKLLCDEPDFEVEYRRQQKLLDTWQQGRLIIGVDEVGRGPLAGPVAVGCVAFSRFPCLPGVRDSKKLGAMARSVLAEEIVRQASFCSVCFIPPSLIRPGNLSRLILSSMATQVQHCQERYPGWSSTTLVDGKSDLNAYGVQNSRAIVQGDDRSLTIGSASIVAKYLRDRYMQTIGKVYPDYGWKKNKGYPTKQHREAIIKHGVTPFHRTSFKGVSEYL